MTRAGTSGPRIGPLLYADVRFGRSLAPGASPLSLTQRQQVDALVRRHGGRLLDAAGQRLSAAFLRHQDALACAYAVRSLLHDLGTGGAASPTFRILLIHGRVPQAGTQEEAHVALQLARQLAHVPPDSISGTRGFVERLPTRPPTVSFGSSRADSRSEPLHLFSAAGFAISEEEKTRELAVFGTPAGSIYAELTLRSERRALTVLGHHCPLTLGRGITCGFAVEGPDVSRVHGRVTYDGQKFAYVDCSRNGSFVALPGGNEVRLHREGMLLVGEGVISLGAPLARQRGELVHFGCAPVRLDG